MKGQIRRALATLGLAVLLAVTVIVIVVGFLAASGSELGPDGSSPTPVNIQPAPGQTAVVEP